MTEQLIILTPNTPLGRVFSLTAPEAERKRRKLSKLPRLK